MLDTRSRGLLDLVLRTLRSGDLEGGKRLTQALLDSLWTAFSLSGAEAGRPAGWMVRAWSVAATQEAVREAVLETYSGLLAHLGALHAIAKFLDVRTEGGVALLMGGLQVAAERCSVMDGADADGLLTREIERIARRSDGLVTEAEILAALQAADEELRSSRPIRTARWWAAAFPGGRYRFPPDIPDPVRRLLEAQRRGRKVRLVGSVGQPEGLYCGCGVRIPETTRQEMERDATIVKQCETCHGHVLPFAIEQPSAVKVLRTFLSDLEDRE